jgi:hypothetical protein
LGVKHLLVRYDKTSKIWPRVEEKKNETGFIVGAKYLVGDNIKVVLAVLSNLSWSVLLLRR